MRRTLVMVLRLFLALAGTQTASAQSYAIGADVSFLGKCEQDGVVFKEDGTAKGRTRHPARAPLQLGQAAHLS